MRSAGGISLLLPIDLSIEETSAKAFEFAQELPGGGTGDAGLAHGWDTGARDREVRDLGAKGTFELRARISVLFPNAGLAISVIAEQ